MKILRFLTVIVLFLCLAPFRSAKAQSPAPQLVILDTDIGDDIDDAFALALALQSPEVKILDDGWTAVTRDRSLSAQFEHMIGVTEAGCEIFTLSPAGFSKPPYSIATA